MIFQTLDDKSECVGVYVDGKIHFDGIPSNLTRTWKYTGSVQDPNVEYAWLYCGGKKLEQVCPPELHEELVEAQKTFQAFLTSFRIGKINLHQICFFDLVPEDFLEQFCEIRNKITEHVFENYDKPKNYDHLDQVYKLLHKIRYQKMNISVDGCRNLMTSTSDREDIRMLVNSRKHYVNYNLFGTVTGRLTTLKDSNPILTMKSKFRSLVKPTNDWFVSFDYNGAEVRTFLALSGHEQPDEDIHCWNMRHLYGGEKDDREEAKVSFFSALYNPKDHTLDQTVYDRKKVLDKFYYRGIIETPMGRNIIVENRKALSYLIQSTTADLTLDRAVALDRALEGKKSKVAFIVHDEVVLDVAKEENEFIADLKEQFSDTKLGKYLVNVKAGKNFGDMRDLEV